MSATVKDVAALAGVSPITASRALANSPLVTEPTRRKVLAACRQCGYRPHAGARALRSRRFNMVGLLLSTAHAYVPQALLAGIADTLEARGIGLRVMRLGDEQLTDPEFAPRVLEERMVDGLLINYCVQIPDRLVRQIRGHRLPSVWINIKEESDCVYPDMAAGAQTAVRHLLDLGHRRIAYVDFVNDISNPRGCHYSVGDAWAGCRQAVERAGKDATLMHLDRQAVAHEGRQALSEAFLARQDRPTALLAAASNPALTCLHAALALGLDVPGDLSIATFHDADVCNETGVTFATVALPERHVGETAVAMLLEKIRQPGAPLPSIALPTTFTPGLTCAPPCREAEKNYRAQSQ